MSDVEIDMREWLISNCGLSRMKADSCCEILEQDGIDNFTQLRLCIKDDPAYLASTTIPRMIQMTMRKKIMELDHVHLESLYKSQVRVLMLNVFPDHPEYAEAYFAKGVSGFVLKAPNVDIEKLKELCDTMTQIHAEALHFHVGQWRTDGVPSSKLVDPTYAHVKNDPSDGGSSIVSDLHGEPTMAVKPESVLRTEQATNSVAISGLSTTQGHPRVVAAPSAITPAKRVQEIAVPVPGLAQPIDILAAVASASREPSDGEAEMDFDDGARTLSGGEESNSDDSSSVSSASASGLSDTSDDDSQASTQRGSASKRRAPSSASSSGAKRLKRSSSPGRREVASLLKETNPPPKNKNKAHSPKASASPRVAPKHTSSSSSASKAKAGGTSGAKPAAKTAAGTTKAKLAVLMSAGCDETDDLVDVLMWASKQVQDRGKEFIHELNNCGATAHMIKMLSPAYKHSEYVVWKILVVLNNIVYKDGSETKFMVEKELVERVLPLCESTCKRVRLQAVWIIGNMSVQIEPALESRIYTAGVSYGTISKMTNPGSLQDNVRQRYAETLLNMVLNGIAKYTPLLEAFLPVALDIFVKEEDHEAVKLSFDALWNLFHGGKKSTLDAAVSQGVIAGLVAHVNERTRATDLSYTLNMLLEYRDQRGDGAPLDELAGAVDPLCKVITSSSVNRKNMSQALELLNALSDTEMPQVAQRVLASSSQMVERLSSLVVSDADGLVASISKASAEILLTVADQDRSERTIADLLNRGFYATLFKILECFDGDAWILNAALGRLSRFVAKVENLLDYQKAEEESEDFDAPEAWELVVELSKGGGSELETVRAAAKTLLALARQAKLMN